jgi:hypothetical protein
MDDSGQDTAELGHRLHWGFGIGGAVVDVGAVIFDKAEAMGQVQKHSE